MRRLAAVVAALAAVMASCGGGGGGDDASPTSTTAVAATTAPAVSTTAEQPTTAQQPTTAGQPTTISTSEPAPATEAPSTTIATPTSAAAPAGSTVGTPVRLAEGSVTAVSPDGSHLIVSEVVEGVSELGCEGELEPVMSLVPTGGGDPVPMFEGGRQHNGNLDQLGDGRAVLLDGCEEFLSEIVVFTWSPDGTLSDPVVVPRFRGDVVENVLGVAWSEGDLLFGLGTTFAFEGLDTRIVSIDIGTGVVTDLLPADEAIVVGRLAGDAVAIGDGETVEVVPLAGGASSLSVPGEWLTVSPDGTAVAVAGPGIVVHGPAPGPEALPVAAPGDPPVIDMSWSPDGQRIAYIARGLEDTVGVVELGADATVIDSARRVFGLTWSADGAVLAYTRIQEEEEEDEGELGALEAMAVRLADPTPGQ